MNNEIYNGLLENINQLYIIDTHEHLPGKESERDKQGDLFTEFLFHYFDRDMVSAGLSREQMDKVKAMRGQVMERWSIIEPFWKLARHTGYGQSLEISARGIYGVDGINRNTIETLYEKFMNGLTEGHFEYVLKEKSRVHIGILDGAAEYDERFFRSAFRADQFVFPEYAEDLYVKPDKRLANSFADWLDACDAHIDQAVKKGYVAMKLSMAYSRPLSIKPADFHEAETCFNGFADALAQPDWLPRPLVRTRAFEDYMLHHVFGRLIKHDVPLQVHTGFLEGNSNDIRKTDPYYLIPTVMRYPDLDFILMHNGYPWHIQLTTMAKTFPNVFLDMCWSHIVSPNAARTALSEWLETVPYNKVCAFGGDYHFIDGVYGHQAMARRNVARVLADKVEAGLFDVDEATEIACRLFLDNPYDIFNLARSGVAKP